mgnify:CR=1 FL=1
MENVWMTREQAAAWLSVCLNTVSNIVREMEEAELPGIWRGDNGFLRINQDDMSEYLRRRGRRK